MPKFDTMIEASKYMTPTDSLSYIIISLFFASLVIVFVGGNMFSKFMTRKHLKEHFFRLAQEDGLSAKDAELLWKMSLEKETDAILLLKYKASFEKAVDHYISNHEHGDDKSIDAIRKKLGYADLPAFMPIFYSKDIDLYQSGKIKLGKERYGDAVLHDKDEKYMYWILKDVENPRGMDAAKTARVLFVRDDDAVYAFESPVEAMFEERGKTVLKLPHTFELHRDQQREISRVPYDSPAHISAERWEEEGRLPSVWQEGRLTDVNAFSVGFRLESVPKFDLQKEQEVTLRFVIEEEEMLARAKIFSIKRIGKTKQYGLRFVNPTETFRDIIFRFVLDEQKKHAKILRLQQQL